ncbi:MAG: MarR family winged helix-turn-helix transcriptional regulator [Pseudomonadota bacterium]
MDKNTDQLDFGPLDEMLGIALQRTFYAAYSHFNRTMGEDFQPGFYSTLALLKRNPGISQKALAAAIRRDKSTLVPFLNKMEERGWVVRERSQSDGRAHELYLTPAGRMMADAFEEKVLSLEASLASALGEGDRASLIRLLRKLDAAVQAL